MRAISMSPRSQQLQQWQLSWIMVTSGEHTLHIDMIRWQQLGLSAMKLIVFNFKFQESIKNHVKNHV